MFKKLIKSYFIIFIILNNLNIFSYLYEFTNTTDTDFDITLKASYSTEKAIGQASFVVYGGPLGAFAACLAYYNQTKHLPANTTLSIETGYCGVGIFEWIGGYYENSPELSSKHVYIHRKSANEFIMNESPEPTEYQKNLPMHNAAAKQQVEMENQAQGAELTIKYIPNKPTSFLILDPLKKVNETFVKNNPDGNYLLHNFILVNKDFANIEQLHYALESAEDNVSAGFLDATNKFKETPLHIAAKTKSRDWALFLVRHHPNLKAKDKDGNTPLHLAAQNFDAYIVRLLLTAGADINAKNNDGRTPFDLVTTSDGLRFFFNKQLLMGQTPTLSDPNILDKNGNTHLVVATDPISVNNKFGFIKIKIQDPVPLNKDLIDKLISAGANINLQDKMGRTPLYAALSRKNYEIAKYLITKYKADVNIPDNSGITPAVIVTLTPDIDMLKFLISNGAKLNNKITDDKPATSPLPIAVSSNKIDFVNLLLSSGADINIVGVHQRTPLHIAVLINSKDMVKLLIDKGANKDAKDADGKTPLDLAKDNKFNDIIKILNPADSQISNLAINIKFELEKAREQVQNIV